MSSCDSRPRQNRGLTGSCPSEDVSLYEFAFVAIARVSHPSARSVTRVAPTTQSKVWEV